MVIRPGIGVGSGKVKVKCASGRVVLEVRVHASHLSSIRIHTAGRLSGLDVPPNHGGHVALVVHETGIEVRVLIRVWGLDMGKSTREGIFLCIC